MRTSNSFTSKRRLVLGVDYDGQGFFGWQIQPNMRSVQESLYQAFISLLGITTKDGNKLGFNPVDIVAAGRTDRGVHARGQVVHVNYPDELWQKTATRSMETWLFGMNALLPDDVRVQWVRWGIADFDARKMAISRHYRYFLQSCPIRPAIGRGLVGWTWRRLDLVAMRSAGEKLLGTHDFSAFRDSQCQANTPVRTMQDFNLKVIQSPLISESTSQENTLMAFDFHANAYLHHMIRNIIGTLIDIGAKRHCVSWMDELLQSRNRQKAGMTFMPDGLYLWQVTYPESLFLTKAVFAKLARSPL